MGRNLNKKVRIAKYLVFFVVSLVFFSPLVQAEEVLVVEIKDIITRGTLETVRASIEKAKEIGAEALILTLDTPGGELEETLEIIKLIDRSEIPIISFVFPQGATAWSAGTLILVSSHVAAMAPHTVIGSAQPVAITPQDIIPVNHTKIINSLTAFIQERARLRGRNETAVVAFITQNLNLNPEQAKEINVVEYTASDLKDLLNQVDGLALNTTVLVILKTKDVEVVYYDVPLKIKFLRIISHPLLASLFMLIGIYAIIFGVGAPGYGSEVAGVILILLGLVGLGFEISLLAMALLIFGIILIVLELQTPQFGVLGVSGAIAMIIGSILLLPTTFPRYFISEEVQTKMLISLAIPSIVTSGFVIFAVAKFLQIRRKKPVIGEFVGDEGIAIEEISPKKTGYVKIKGEIWKATSKQKIGVGEKIVVIGTTDLTLVIKRKK